MPNQRPKIPGLWVLLTLSSGGRIEGVMDPNLRKHNPQQGFSIIRVEHKGRGRVGSRKVFIPVGEVQSAVVLGIIGGEKDR